VQLVPRPPIATYQVALVAAWAGTGATTAHASNPPRAPIPNRDTALTYRLLLPLIADDEKGAVPPDRAVRVIWAHMSVSVRDDIRNPLRVQTSVTESSFQPQGGGVAGSSAPLHPAHSEAKAGPICTEGDKFPLR
jgi:hypothetical protein